MKLKPLKENLAKWKPTEKQRRMLTIWQSHNYRCTAVDAAKEGGISEQAWYCYFKTPHFAKWWDDEFRGWRARQLPRIEAALIASAAGEDVGGHPADRKTALELMETDYAPRSRNVTRLEHADDSTDNANFERLGRIVAAAAAAAGLPGGDSGGASGGTAAKPG